MKIFSFHNKLEQVDQRISIEIVHKEILEIFHRPSRKRRKKKLFSRILSKIKRNYCSASAVLVNETRISELFFQPDAPTLNVLHLSDIHIDFQYQPGSIADCQQPLCCRTGSPMKNGAGFW